MSRGRRKEQQDQFERKRTGEWQEERDDDQAREESPQDDYPGMDAYANEAKEFRS